MKKSPLRTIIKVQTTKNFHLICTFDNQVTKDYDMSFILAKDGPMIEPLKHPNYFMKVFLEMGTPTWPNGFDVCCDQAFLKGQPVLRNKRQAT